MFEVSDENTVPIEVTKDPCSLKSEVHYVHYARALDFALQKSRLYPSGNVTIGSSRNYVTCQRGNVIRVIFWDCFWSDWDICLEPSKRQYDHICEQAALSCDDTRMVARSWDSYAKIVSNNHTGVSA